MKYLYQIAFFILFLNFTANAQTDFKSGYIVPSKGDTVKGLVNYKQWSINQDQLIFKKDVTAPETIYTKETAPAFGVEGYGNYHLFTIRLRQYTSAPGDQINFADTLYANKNIYLNEIVIGKKVSLYKYDDGGKSQLLIAEGNSTPRELTGYIQMNYDSYSKLEAIDTFKKQLLQLATTHQPGNNSITRQIEMAEYKVSNLKSIIMAINGDNDVEYVEKLRKKSRFFVGIGLNANATKFTGEKHMFHSLGNVWSYFPMLNAGLDFFSDKDAKLMFRGEINLSPVQTEFTYTNTIFAGTPAVTTYTYKDNFTRVMVSVNPQIVYYFYNKTKVKVFIAGGPKLDLNVHDSHKQTTTSVGIGSVSTIRPYIPLRPVYVNVTAKTGVKIEKFQIYGGYVTPFNLHEQLVDAMVNTSFNFGINYFLGK